MQNKQKRWKRKILLLRLISQVLRWKRKVRKSQRIHLKSRKTRAKIHYHIKIKSAYTHADFLDSFL